ALRSQIDSGALERIAQREPSDRPMKIVVVKELPPTGRVYGTNARYTKALHDYLALGRGTLLVVTQSGPVMATDALPSGRIDEILKRNVGAIQRNPVRGIESTVADLDASVSGKPLSELPPGAGTPQPDQGVSGWLIGIPLVAVGGAAVWASRRAARKRKA